MTLKGAPDKPAINTSQLAVTAVSISVTWMSGYNGGSTQTFTVHLRGPQQTDFIQVNGNVTDPGFKNVTGRVLLGLREKTCYDVMIKVRNGYRGGTEKSSESVRRCTNGRYTEIIMKHKLNLQKGLEAAG